MARAVLITGARAAAALDLARAFVAEGWDIHLADCVTARMARWSRLAVLHHRYPSPRSSAAEFRARIVDLIERHSITLVVPTCEEVFHLAAPAMRDALSGKLLAPDLASLRQLHDKLAFATSCGTWGLNGPESHAIESVEELAAFLASSRDWVFKPRFSRFGDRTLISPSAAELASSPQIATGGWMAQRRIAGDEVCFHAVACHGVLTGFAAYRSHWRLGGGASYAFEPVGRSRSEHLSDIAAAIAQKAGMHGQFACDVLFDIAGEPWLLECNPRATSGIHILIAQGAASGALSGEVQPPAIDDSRPIFLGPAMWVLGLPLAIRTGRLREWCAMITKGRDAISRRGDRAPALGALVDAAAFAFKGLAMGISTNAATTCDIEWNGEDLA